ncbi:MAG: rhomboid family intramembrane serine protease, partial [Actinomycetota bacterium]|nr:rhomboid family intramembrane serine protease [Actinomycetota bacterium]
MCEHRAVDYQPPGSAVGVDEAEQTYCYAHPKTPTKLSCSRCGRPICGRCAIPASVGQHCPECVAEAKRSAPRVRHINTSAAPATYATLAILVAIFIVQLIVPKQGPFDYLSVHYGLFQPAIANKGEFYRLFTTMLLHAGFPHIAFNGYALFLIGPFVERVFGSRRFVGIFVATGLLGSAASYMWGPCNELGVGASGAIFGLLGCLAVYVYRRRDNPAMNMLWRNIVFILILNAIIGIAASGEIDVRAHAGGFVGGLIVGGLLDHRGGN